MEQNHKIHTQTQNNRGRRTQQEIWVLGMVDTLYNLALEYMKIIQQRDAETLLPIINSQVAPSAVVYTDKWTAYRRLGSLLNVSSHMIQLIIL